MRGRLFSHTLIFGAVAPLFSQASDLVNLFATSGRRGRPS